MTRSRDAAADDERFRHELVAHRIPGADTHPLPVDDNRAALELARILALPQREPTPLERLKVAVSSWGFRRVAMPVVAAVAVLAAAIVIVVHPGRDFVAQADTPPLLTLRGVQPGDLPVSGEPARDVLHALAVKALDLPYDPSGPVQHVVVDSWFSETVDDTEHRTAQSILRSVHRESYFLPDNTFRSIEWRGDPLDQNGRVTLSGETDRSSLTDESFSSPDPGADYAENLPTEPDALRDALLAGFDARTLADASGGALLGQATALTSSYVLPPRLLSALLKVLAGDASITLLGSTHDRLDREALILSAPAIDGHSQQLLLVDPDTGAITGDEMVLVRSSASYSFDPPAVTSFSTIVGSERIGYGELPPVAGPS